MSLLLFFGGSGMGGGSSSIYPGVAVDVELAGVGGGWTNIASDVFRNPGIDISRGIPGGGPRDLVAGVGTCRFAVNNSAYNSAGTAGYYSPHHASRLQGWRLNIRVRVRLTDPATNLTYTVFIGKIASMVPMPGVLGLRRVEVTAVDWLDEAARWNITAAIEPQVNKRADELIPTIVAEMPDQPIAEDYDVTADVYAYSVDVSRIGESPALAEFARIAASGFDLIYLEADGTLRLESRHTRLLNTTVDWTLDDDDLAYDGGLEIEANRDDILNTVRATAHTKLVDDSPDHVVYEQTNEIALEPGVAKILIGPYRDQDTGDSIGAVDVQDPIAGVDYIANSAQDGSGADHTADLTIVLSKGASGARFEITNGHSAMVYLILSRLFGKRVRDWATDMRELSDATSISNWGEHAVALDMPYQGNGDVAEGACAYVLGRWGAM